MCVCHHRHIALQCASVHRVTARLKGTVHGVVRFDSFGLRCGAVQTLEPHRNVKFEPHRTAPRRVPVWSCMKCGVQLCDVRIERKKETGASECTRCVDVSAFCTPVN
jgi:hypothetical protein